MSDFPADQPHVTPTHLSTMHMNWLITAMWSPLGSPPSITWVANYTVFVPFNLAYPYPVRRVFWINGSAAGGTTYVAVYTLEGKKMLEGSAVGSGNDTRQYVDVTDTLLAPGRYYIALAHDSATANHLRGYTSIATSFLRLGGVLQQNSATTPTDMSSAAAATQQLWPLCGVTRAASGY